MGDDRFQSAQRFFGGKEADLQSLLMFVEESAKEALVLNNIILSFICQMLELIPLSPPPQLCRVFGIHRLLVERLLNLQDSFLDQLYRLVDLQENVLNYLQQIKENKRDAHRC
ncbi:hypothetical protein SAY87_019188 [Trapa incisa]|uniref:Uncharacterized protein n=1 Tax=Trapa incisa TaxID=236973 RepID=A0AAN7K227_9MYRT|nr:hypothetical protein SAY87_019188 [Trapa incisa]